MEPQRHPVNSRRRQKRSPAPAHPQPIDLLNPTGCKPQKHLPRRRHTQTQTLHAGEKLRRKQWTTGFRKDQSSARIGRLTFQHWNNSINIKREASQKVYLRENLLTESQYPVIGYSPSKGCVFCFVCLLFGKCWDLNDMFKTKDYTSSR